MTTVEKLFVQLNERKKSILELVNRRTELYSQHLASKLLIDGFNPPSWLLDPNSASGTHELNKEDLISKLLRPYPQPSASCSVVHYPGYGNLVLTGDNEEFSDRDFVENPAFNKDSNRKNDPTAPGVSAQARGECVLNSGTELDASVDMSRKNDPTASGFSGQARSECVLNSVLEQDASVASPKDQADKRILNVDTAPDQSLARIQRSKSRQKALVLRSSAKAPAKNGLRHEGGISDVVSSQIRFSLSIANQPCQIDELSQLAEPCVIGSQSYENRNVVEALFLSRDAEVGTLSERNARSENFAEISGKGSFSLGSSSENYKENASSQDARARRSESIPISNSNHANNHVTKSPKSTGALAVCCESYRDRGVEDADFLCKDEETNVNNGEITRPEISSKQKSCGRDSTKADSSSDDHVIDTAMMDSGDDPPQDFVDRSLVKVNLSTVQNEGCDVQESGSTRQVNDGISHIEVLFASAKIHGDILAPSSAGSTRQVNDLQELSGLVKPSVELFCSVTRSQSQSHGSETYQPVMYNKDYSFGGTKSISDCEESSSLVKVNVSNVLNEGCNAQESSLEDFGRNKERDTWPSSSPIEHNVTNEISHLEVPSASAKVHACILAPSSAASTRHVNDSQELSGLIKSSVGLFRRVTRSQSHSYGSDSYQRLTYIGNHSFGCTKSISDSEEKSAEKLHNTSSGESVPACLGIHNMLHDDKNGHLVVDTELVHSCLSSSNYSKQIRGLDSEVELIPSDSCVSVEPKQLVFKETEEFNSKALTSRSAKRSLDNLPQNMSCSLDVPDVSLDKGICGENYQPSLTEQLRRMSDVSCKEEIAHTDSLEPDGQESPNNQAVNIGSVIGRAILNVFNDSTEAEPSCRSSEVQDEADNLSSKMADIIDIQNSPVKPHVKLGLESSPVHCMEQGEFSDEGRDKGQLVSSVSESKNSMLSYGHSSADDPVANSYNCLIMKVGTDPTAINDTMQDPAHQPSLENNHLGSPSSVTWHGTNSSLERRFTRARIESWPQAKRRKVEHQQAHFTTSQSFRVTMPHSFKRDPDNAYRKTMEIDVETGLMDHANKITHDGICSEVNTNQMEGIQSATLSQHGEVGPCYIEKNECNNTSPVINNKQLGTTISSSAMKESRNSQGSFIERTRASSCDYLDARAPWDKQCSQPLCNLENYTDDLNSEDLDLSSTLHKEIQQSPKWVDGLHTQHSVISSSNGHLPFTDVDQSIPEFEGFIVDAEADTCELDFATDGFGLGELELPRTTLERASFLAEICKSASLDRPSTHFSSAFKFETQNLCKSIPGDGHLTLMEFGNSYPSNPDVGIHFQPRSSSSDDYKETLDGMQYSVSLPYSGERYGWNSRNQPSSPVGKLWDQLSSHSGSSGKGLSSNPELTCFPIEEDPSSSEDINTMEENAGDTQDETDSSLANHCDKSLPLKDLTNIGKKSPMSVYAKEETLRADSVGFLCSKFSVTGTEDSALLGPKQTDGRKHQFSSIGPKAVKRAKESVNNSTSKSISNSIRRSIVSNKTTLKEPRRNNIVSNVTSFIPLVQQKQAATACTGKRDVKVKALEAAEAAKILEEKRENERKMRKEALKLERAKMEEKNLRHMELEKKKKEEERKKKDADIVAKKRLREEEEKKEKLKKRMRLETRHHQREQEENKRAKRPEKENQRTKDDQMNNKKEFNNESKRQQNRPTTRGESMALQKGINLTLNEVVMNYEECGTSGLSNGEVMMHAMDKSPRKEDLLVQNSQGKSYEISPYQGSDNEDDEDDVPTNKYIPSWGSKSSVALFLPLQQELDPNVIFPWDRSCSMDEVLLPRKKQPKQVAA